MKNIVVLLLIGLIIISCNRKKEVSSINQENWKKRTTEGELSDSLKSGMTYLSVYSQIYGITEHKTLDLTATISIRNTNRHDTVFILKAEYFNTRGELIRSYINKPIFIAPIETVEIVIDEIDQEGGTGANFIFEWKTNQSSNDPFFESVMISASGQQGLSFTSQGILIN